MAKAAVGEIAHFTTQDNGEDTGDGRRAKKILPKEKSPLFCNWRYYWACCPRGTFDKYPAPDIGLLEDEWAED